MAKRRTGGDQPFLFVSTTTRGVTAQRTIPKPELVTLSGRLV